MPNRVCIFCVLLRYIDGINILSQSDVETVKVNSGFFARLIAFFLGLFGLLPKLTQAYLGVEFTDRNRP